MTTAKTNTTFAAMATLAILALSCSPKVGEPPPPAGMDPPGGGSDTTGGGGPATEPAKPTMGAPPSVPTDPLPTTGGGMAGQITPIETPVTPPPPEVIDAEKALQQKLDTMTAAIPGTSVKFINTNETPHTARLESRTLPALRDLLAAISQDNQGRISFMVREQLGGYMGQTYTADVTLGTDQSRAVPTDAAELLTE